MPCLFRPLTGSDLDAVLRIQAECYPPAMQEAAEVVMARLRAAPGTCLAAVDDGQLCAYLFAYPSRLGLVTDLGAGFTPARDPDTLYLHDLAVARRALGRGVARGMVGRLLDQARQQGLAWSALVSVQDTLAFWEGLGYRAATASPAPTGRGLGSYPGAAVYMARPLA